nr:MAG TPA: nucleoid-associated protein [Bacteriophage sp.]
MIKVIYNKTCGRCVQSEPLTSGMVGQPIEFEYSPDFDGLTLTAVFTNGKTTVDVLNPGNQCVIPHEVLDTVGTLVKVGIYAVRGNELVIPTVYAAIGIVLKGADPSGDVSADPTLPVWAQIQALMGNLNDLNTEAKNNLVAAINEAAQTGSGGASIAMRVDGGYIQYSTDNGKTWVNLIAEADLKGDKGADGAPGEKGDPGTPGQDGHSPVVTATKSGKTTTISVDGTAIATVEDGAAGTPGKNGTDGHTPVKGTDYWTASDKAEIVAEVTAALPKYGGETA